MTKETEMKIKHDLYAKMREKAVNCLTAMGAKPAKDMKPDSWEGVMTMLEYVFKHAPKDHASMSAAILAAIKWMWAHLECEAMNELDRMHKLFEEEQESAKTSK